MNNKSDDIEKLLSEINFIAPEPFVNFLKNVNSTQISINDDYIILWSLKDMARLNKEYMVEEYAPEFFIFGSNGGDEAYAIEKSTGYIYQIPFIGMNKKDAILKFKDFSILLDSINK